MWQNNKSVTRTHSKNGSQMAWAIIDGVAGNKWLRVRPNAADGVTNVFILLSIAKANGRRVDVLVNGDFIEQATLR